MPQREEPGKKRKKIDLPDAVEAVFTSAPGLSRRPGQVRMARAVARLLRGEWPALAVEAGTGTGKSLAYLVPAMLYALREGGRVVVATRTKNLQEQLAGKDALLAADLVAQHIDVSPPAVAVLKGKGNYLCPAVLEDELKKARKKDRLARRAWRMDREVRETKEPSPPVFSPRTAFLAALKLWTEIGGSGELDDLPAWPGLAGNGAERERWFHSVSAASPAAECAGCPAACSFARARREAGGARIVITNHAMVAADFVLRRKTGKSVFHGRDEAPPDVLIIDEAHNFPESFRDALGTHFSRLRWARLRGDLENSIDSLSFRVLARLEGAERENFIREKETDMQKLRELAGRVDRAVDLLVRKYSGAEHRRPRYPGETGGEEENAAVLAGEFFGVAENILKRYVDLCGDVDRDLTRKADRLLARMAELREALSRAVLMNDHYRAGGNDACWVEGGVFHAAPVRLQDYLPCLWGLYPGGVVFTSATLFPFPQSDGFRWFREEFALPEDTACGVVESPFDYGRQMKLYVPTDACLSPGSGEKPRRLAELVARVAGATPGGVLVLCTSLREMEAVKSSLAGLLSPDRVLLVQGDAGKGELSRRFAAHGRAVLVGFDSFWEGVDFPGDVLTAVVISKLPFPAPDDPIVEARTYLAGGGWPAARRVSVPLCAVKLRQGVGRLIRRETDAGIVVIADPRLSARHKKLLEVLPVTPWVGPVFPREQDRYSETSPA
ncbi:ATP-dependent DNA helicase [Desulfofundulus sp. TPOSR]|uniref:ATP-dependent DNA helicase n=1 Tax=Desulfofundulus sp. TPOSR TaxID=2714340 RepID=UPI00140E5856|nr:ATP-dependent DNA helicase [Desulfofundulus sp. TPOSR]NHM27977.1 ATP-dependent DNA helicase [Desulfofundulus sp. TPOSR]